MNAVSPKHIPARYCFASTSIPVRDIYPKGMEPQNPGMDINEIRLANLRALATREGSGAALARRLDMAYPLLQNYIGKTPTKRIGDKTARRAEEVFSLERGWMDTLHQANGAATDAKSPQWPFKTARSRFDALPEAEQARVGRFLADTVQAWEETQTPDVRKAG